LAVLLALELLLRLTGFGYATAFFIPADKPGKLVSNDAFPRQFFQKEKTTLPFLTELDDPKPTGKIRIFLLGESAAMGAPDPAFGMARMLEVMLRYQYPGRDLEVVNAALWGIDSHVVRRIALDCARHDADLLVVYAGNNEGVGLHAPNPDTSRLAMNLDLIRFSQWCKRTRMGQLAWQAISRNTPPTQDMEFFRRHRKSMDDPRMDLLRENYRANLADICRTGGPRLPKVLSTLSVNLLDCPPLGSLHRSGLAAADLARWEKFLADGIAAETVGQYTNALILYREALALDDHYAELHYRLARCLRLTGNLDAARKHFGLACNWDTLPFRADQRLNGIVRGLAAEFQGQGVRLCDAEAAMAASELSDDGVPGLRAFYEHVHPTFAGTHLLAGALCAEIRQALAAKLGAPAHTNLPTVAECATTLCYTRLDAYNVTTAITRLTAGAPFLDQVDHPRRQAAADQVVKQLQTSLTPTEVRICMATYLEGIHRRPDDWVLRFNYAYLNFQIGRPSDSLEHYEWLIQHYPRQSSFHEAYGNVLLEQGRKDEAMRLLSRAAQLAPYKTSLKKTVARSSAN
jgi:Flp pilus assembly protein TadD